ncbi:DNA polymerase epsilon subunit 3 Chrac-14 [Amblyomma americanum]|uniref:DNA polymerase epsilon subunit 3 n=1 Tax=Amblyomma americanum TaxID=6943 RepID=A0A0C9S1B5_AMBAM
MAERPEDLNLPLSVVTRIVKDALPDGVNVSKDARAALAKAASVFVLYTTSCANNFAMKGKRKTVTGADIISAMEEMELQSFVDALSGNLAQFRTKKDAIRAKKHGGAGDAASAGDADPDSAGAGDAASAGDADPDSAGDADAVSASDAEAVSAGDAEAVSAGDAEMKDDGEVDLGDDETN